MRIIYIPKKVSPVTTIKYGLLYNWFAVAGTGLASVSSSNDWIIPSESNYNTLISYVGSSSAFDLMDPLYWSRTDETNIYKFNARASGFRNNSGGFEYAYPVSFQQMFAWTNDSPTKKYFILANNINTISIATAFQFTYGMSLRLLKLSTLLSDGQEGTYLGNDGKKYRTICIGTQEWLADNLAETKYRDGSTIPEVTVDATWAALTTGARCSYNNDPSNV